ncbi:putative manganese-dependent inorganic diphosphatase [Luteolibacter sp. AS25]|uniref:putative manganese-dependent inorganic diphosphatase n=1 Tax=Luteolibacter sp. AS25 TaxID=3135776 RepID=UPI00398BB3EF
MSPFYVIGHKNPDTDAICSALGHAAFLKATGDEPEAVAARCGEVPQRTAWVLEKAGIAPPQLLMDARTTAGMICKRDVIQVKPSDTFLTAYNRMLSASVRCVPVVSEDGKVEGILQYINLLKLLLPDNTDALSVRTVHASLNKIADTVEAESLGAPIENDEERDLILLVGASSKKTVENRLDVAIEDKTISDFLVICGDRPVVQQAAIEKGACALLVTGNHEVTKDIIDLANSKGTVLLRCRHDTASANTLIRCSRTVVHVMEKDFISVNESQPVSTISKQLATSNQDLFPVMDDSGKNMLGVLVKSDLVDPPSLRFALVDHNEYSQAISGIDEATITEVIDHHRLSGDITSREPIRYLNEPVGSSCTLVARKFFYRSLDPAPGIALCLCGGIVSDTLCLTSPTTTDLDREMLEWLSGIAKVEAKKFSEEFFAVGSLMATGSAEDILHTDRKEFNEQGLKVSISQVEELDLHGFKPRHKELETALVALAESGGYDLTVLAVTDIAKMNSMVLVIGSEEVIEGLPFKFVEKNLYLAPGVVSRKRQLFPAVCEAIKQSSVGV